jgi:disulfide bond formation protein DsbB
MSFNRGGRGNRASQRETGLGRQRTDVVLAAAILLIATGTIAGALIIEVLGYAPCPLCLMQRWPYYIGIPLSSLALFFALRGPKIWASASFLGLALLFAGSAIFATYHAGVEWGLWPGPKDCSGVLDQTRAVEDFFKQLQRARVVRCDAPALTILSLSLAAWNAVISASLAWLSAWGLWRAKT